MIEEKKKSNNPFMMWGTYIGMLLGLVGSYFSYALVFHYAEQGNFSYWVLLIPTFPFIIGLLLGYFIHLGLRKVFS